MKLGTIVVGGGASGLLASILLARQGETVLLLEKNQVVGKKLSATGNGRCNFTNQQMGSDHYYSSSPDFVETILAQATMASTVSLFLELGIIAKEKDGYYYPFTNQAASILSVFQSHCKTCGVDIHTEETVQSIEKKELFQVVTNLNTYQSERVILAAGGKASPSLGGSDSGYGLARSLGHQITPVFPALTGLTLVGKEWDKFGGIRGWGSVTLEIDGTVGGSSRGELQFVKDGISGIPVFQVSRLAAQALVEKKKVTGFLDLMPDMTQEQLAAFLQTNDLRGILKKRAIGPVLARCNNSKPQEIARVLKNYTFTVTDTSGFDKAQVTGGGIPVEEIEPTTMESRIHKGLYITGELIDVDGQCGGYNLQWAWSTAMVACQSITQNRRITL